ncbi:MAG: segregation/condensation protein A [Hyphomicrobiaceae bacterium]|nr:segregation/condensation protein A [Hyphomicrobiaceae bacterium]
MGNAINPADPDRPATVPRSGFDAWDPNASERRPDDPTLVVDVGGYEGPLDLLLTLARSQKVDLARISILDLANQYLAFIDEARKLRLELAADYLVMAAWLAYLKSRLLLPEPPKDEEPTGAEMAEMLAFRLRKLEAMRAVAAQLMNRNRLGRDVFARGRPEPIAVRTTTEWGANIADFLSAYAALRQRQMITRVEVGKRTVWSLADARTILERLLGQAFDWMPVEAFIRPYMTEDSRASVRASSFSAMLEMVREGRLELRQNETFGTIYVRQPRPPAPDATAAAADDEG